MLKYLDISSGVTRVLFVAAVVADYASGYEMEYSSCLFSGIVCLVKLIRMSTTSSNADTLTIDQFVIFCGSILFGYYMC